MAQLPEIEELAERRRRLVAESARCREDIAREFQNLAAATAWVERSYSIAQSVRGWWPVIGLVAGVLVTKKGGFFFRTLAKGWSWWQLVKRVAPIWRRVMEAVLRRNEKSDSV